MTTQTIDLTPSWTGVLRLLLEGYSNGTPKGQRMALEELTRMAVLADEYVKQAKQPKQPVSLMMDDTARVERTLEWIRAYVDALNRDDLCPNGDDFNALDNGVVSILRDGIVLGISLTSEGR